MMLGTGLLWVPLVMVPLLGAAVLVKYLFFGGRR